MPKCTFEFVKLIPKSHLFHTLNRIGIIYINIMFPKQNKKKNVNFCFFFSIKEKKIEIS